MPTDPLSRLAPRPRSIRVKDPDARCRGNVESRIDPSLPAQGYTLDIDADRAVLVHADSAGLRYGLQTVAALRAADGSLPAVAIEDWPDFAVRGAMLDVSRDRVPTRDTLARLVKILSLARYNHLQLYIEHTFAYADHEDVWRNASPITPSDLMWLDDLCAVHGIELVANQNCFGHMGRWLALDRYAGQAECPGGTELVPGLRWPPGVLAPTPANAEFALSLVREQMEYVRSRTVNIGCDETFELGKGVSAERVAAHGLGAVYGEHLDRLVRPLLADGLAVQVWADVLAHHPDALAMLPPGDVAALVWNYDAPDAPSPTLAPALAGVLASIGIDVTGPTDFESRLAAFASAGLPTWVVPGTSSWNSIIGRLDNAQANLLDAARAGCAAGVAGYLVTDWGDGGHHQPPSVSDPAWLYGGAVSWGAAANADLDVAAWFDEDVAEDENGTIGGVLAMIGVVHARTGMVARNLSPLVGALFPHQHPLMSGTPDLDAIREVITTLDAARDDLARSTARADDATELRAELDVSIALARHGATRLAVQAGESDPGPDALQAELSALVAPFRAAWLARSRPGGLDDSVAHIERTVARYSRDR